MGSTPTFVAQDIWLSRIQNCSIIRPPRKAKTRTISNKSIGFFDLEARKVISSCAIKEFARLSREIVHVV
jgi:hypothetical protein